MLAYQFKRFISKHFDCYSYPSILSTIYKHTKIWTISLLQIPSCSQTFRWYKDGSNGSDSMEDWYIKQLYDVWTYYAIYADAVAVHPGGESFSIDDYIQRTITMLTANHKRKWVE